MIAEYARECLGKLLEIIATGKEENKFEKKKVK
jgi:hypothetical protein